MTTKSEAREVVKKVVDAYGIDHCDPVQGIQFYNCYGRMAIIRLSYKYIGNECRYYGYKFHILPAGNRVADARGWGKVNEPLEVGWDKADRAKPDEWIYKP